MFDLTKRRLMRWFTSDWHSGVLSEAQAERVVQEYRQHIDRIQDRLSGKAYQLAHLNLHDGWVLNYTYGEGVFTWALLIGDLQVGYEIATLTYADAHLNMTLQELDGMDLTSDAVEVLYDEVDLFGEGCVHRVSFWPSGELHIAFATVSVARVPVSDRRRN